MELQYKKVLGRDSALLFPYFQLKRKYKKLKKKKDYKSKYTFNPV